MKRQIRRGVFETNSSSTHAICITKDNMYQIEKHIDFRFGEYGWEYREYDTPHEKASYLITAIFSYSKDYADKYWERLKSILDSKGITYSIKLPAVKYDDALDCSNYYDLGYCYIDHVGETSEFVEAVLADPDRLMRYLFGDSFIVTGNDNSDGYDDRMYTREGESKYGYYIYGDLKPEFDDYEVYEKGN